MIDQTIPNETVAVPSPQLAGAATTTKAPRAASTPGLDKRLSKLQLMVSGVSSNRTIGELLAPLGYGPDRVVGEGRQLLAEVQQRMSEQALASGDATSAREERDRTFKLAREQFARDVALARFALRDDRGAQQKLGLHLQRKTSQTGWLVQARQFYGNATGDPLIQQLLAAANLTLDMLESGRGLVEHVDHCLVRHAAMRGAAKEATRRRNEAVQRMDTWMVDLRAIARVGLRGRPELLRQLGL